MSTKQPTTSTSEYYQDYILPDLGVTVRARTVQEAETKAKKIAKEQSNDSK